MIGIDIISPLDVPARGETGGAECLFGQSLDSGS